MTKKYSVAHARQNLPSLLHEVEDGAHVEITRRGRSVAVVIPLTEYERLTGSPGDFHQAWQGWRLSVQDEDLEQIQQTLDEARDTSVGREILL